MSKYSQQYFTFKVTSDGVIRWKNNAQNSSFTGRTISYSLNSGTTWTDITSVSGSSAPTISVSSGDTVMFKGNNSNYAIDNTYYAGFSGTTCGFEVEGNIMSLVYGDNFIGNRTLTDNYAFCSLFKWCNTLTSAENLVLPATTLTECCYRAMFSNCTNMTVAPKLPATTLAPMCYWYMFEKCTLITSIELPAKTLVGTSNSDGCYGHMFTSTTNLTYIKCLADNPNTIYTYQWLYAGKTGTFVKAKGVEWPSEASGIPTGMTVEEYSEPLKPVPINKIFINGNNIN